MDTDLKCNRLTCRRPLTDKAVVTTCSHIFCVDCANELFNASRLCPACETTLSEPDDVVVCSLHPSNDYKTVNCAHTSTFFIVLTQIQSVLSGLSPSIILEICSRAISFWQYQTHQENSFQQAVVRNVNDKNAQLQKQLENVVREANGEINLLSNKNAELERDLELERRKIRDLQDTARERDKEYQKLKAQHDKIKRKALLPGPAAAAPAEDQRNKLRAFSNAVDLGAVVGGMEASGIQRTPLVNRTSGATFAPASHGNSWAQHQQHQQIQQQHHQQQHQQQQQQHAPHSTQRKQSHRQPFAAQNDRAYQSGNTSDRSSNEVENMLLGGQSARATANHGWSTAPIPRTRPAPRVFAPPTNQQRMPGGFRPAGVPRS